MCPIGYKRGHKRGHKEGYIRLVVILAKINNTKFNSIGLGLSPSLCQRTPCFGSKFEKKYVHLQKVGESRWIYYIKVGECKISP